MRGSASCVVRTLSPTLETDGSYRDQGHERTHAGEEAGVDHEDHLAHA